MKKQHLSLLQRTCLLFLAIIFNGFCADMLYVFTANGANVLDLQNKLRSSISDIEIEVFGRYRDFAKKIELAPPSAVLTRPELLSSLTRYTSSLEGTVNGKSTTPYILLSIGKQVDLSTLPSITVAAVGFMGRKEMKSFVTKMVGSSTKVKLVTKNKDLLPLLTFEMAQAALVSKNSVSYFKSKSNIELIETNLPGGKAGIMMLGVKEGSEPANLTKNIKSLSKETNSILEVEAWK